MNGEDELLSLREELRGHYGTLISEIEKDEDYYRGNYAKDVIPTDWADESLKQNPTVPATAYNAVENASDHILTTPKFWVPSRPVENKKEEMDRIASEIARFLSMAFHRIRIDNGQPLERGKKKLVKEGKLVLKKCIDWDVVPDLDDRRKYRAELKRRTRSRFPWKLELCPNQTIFEDPDNPFDPAFVFEEYETTVRAAKRMFPDAKGDWLNGRGSDKVKYTEYWSKPEGNDTGMLVKWIGDERIHEDANPYGWSEPWGYEGYVPYAIGESGWGDVDPDAKPEDRYVGILRPIRSILIAEARQLTSVEAWLRFNIWNMVVTKGIPEEQDIEVGPGKRANIMDEQEINVLQLGTLDPATFQFLTKIQQEADRSSKFGALGGVAQRGVDTATEADMNIRNAATRLTGPVGSLQRMVIQLAGWMLMDIEHVFEAPVTIYGAVKGAHGDSTLGPRDINGYYQVHAELGTTDQAALNDRNARLWNDLYRINPFLSGETALEQSGVEDPNQEMVKRLAEDSLLDPMSRAYRTQAHLQTLGDVGQRYAMAAEQQALGGGTAAPAAPAGDEQALTTVNGMDDPAAAMRTRGREDAMADQSVNAYR